MLADIDDLVYGSHAPNDRPIADGHMTSYLRIVAHDTIITDNTVVGKMAIGQAQAVFADDRLISCLGTAVYSHKLTYGRTISYKYIGILTLEFEILWDSSYYRPGEYPAIPTDAGTFHDSHVRPNPGSIANLNILVYNCKRINLYIGRKSCIRMDICMWMNHVLLKKHPPQRSCAKVIVTAKNGIFFVIGS